MASVMMGYAEEGRCPSYERAFLELFGKYPREVVGWWRDRRKLLFLALDADRPTPLLLANRANELLLRDLIEIPDCGFVPEGTLPHLRSVPYVGEYHGEEFPRAPRAASPPESVCIHCAKPTCAGSKIHCYFHYRQNAKASLRCRKRKVAQGICRNCSKPVELPSQLFCAFHRDQHNARNRPYMQLRCLLQQA